ncbi:MAG TPA: pyrroloquinoline quinone biosynthesis protein PqqB, partial [Thermohalobaculum sp.]|nr:pyrroloquinoline quinone biosynthesis protein PqqB [Thermohalobaculum sp.]
IAASADGESWAIVNASPDVRAQFMLAPALHPGALRHTPVRSVLLTNGDIDHAAGLLSLRERQPFSVFATAETGAALRANPMLDALDPALVTWHEASLGPPFELAPGLTAELFAVPGKVPLYLEEGEVRTDLEDGQTVGVRLTAGAASAFYIPGCARMTRALAGRLGGAPLVLFDGTLWDEDEMISSGTGSKTATRMGHMPIDGAAGSLAAFAGLGVGRKVYVHVNNTNPILDPASPQRRAVEEAGWMVAEDGMELTL